MDFLPTEEQAAIREMALGFATKELAPFAVEWDQTKHFPVDTLRKAGAWVWRYLCPRRFRRVWP
jgi:alkylation response protein AidB-like acyl-CoA dehydrogenase